MLTNCRTICVFFVSNFQVCRLTDAGYGVLRASDSNPASPLGRALAPAVASCVDGRAGLAGGWGGGAQYFQSARLPDAAAAAAGPSRGRSSGRRRLTEEPLSLEDWGLPGELVAVLERWLHFVSVNG